MVITIVQISKPIKPVPGRAVTRLSELVAAATEEICGDSLIVSTPEHYASFLLTPGKTHKIVYLLAVEGELSSPVASPYGFPLVAGSPDGVALWEDWLSEQPTSITPEAPWDNRVLGSCEVTVPMKENLDSAYVDFQSLEQDADVLAPLWEAAQHILQVEGRTKVGSWTDNPLGDELSAPSSTISFNHTHISHFLADAGFELNQNEQCIRLSLPVAEETLNSKEAEAKQKAEGYRFISWEGPTPPQYLEKYVNLINAFHADIPTVGLILNEMEVDVGRLTLAESNDVKRGTLQVVTAAEHIETGDLVGYTKYDLYRDSVMAVQEDTLVLKDHRGHRLGLLVKIENLRYLQEHYPDRTIAQTWNAGENDWMIAINGQLGYQPYIASGQWQIELKH